MEIPEFTYDAFTGLEAAIVLIAFVVVAAVFSYVILGAGFFTTQKSQEVIHTSVDTASSTIGIAGNVYGISNSGGSKIDMINFSVSLAAGGSSIDFEKVVITYSNSTELDVLSPVAGWRGTPVPGTWAITEAQNEVGGSNNLLQMGEMYTITAYPPEGPIKNDEFTLEVRPSKGSTVGISRTVPASINTVNILY
jgi:flagellin FlaB